MTPLRIRQLKSISARSVIFSAIVFFFFFILLVRLFYLGIIKGNNYRKISEENRTRIIFTPAPRGDIFDRHGKVLVTNHPAFTLTYTPVLSSGSASLAEVAPKLAGILDLDRNELLNQLETAELYPFQSVRIKTNLSRQDAFYISELNLDFPGFNIQVEPVRNYLYNDLASHLLGYIGEISREELENQDREDYKLTDLIGKTGVERFYDAYIRGTDGGTSVEVSASGRQTRILNKVEPVRGDDIVLTIDLGLQRIVEEIFADYRGSVIIMDPNNGDILALVSKPGFNPNFFLPPINKREISYLLTSSRLPLFNRAIQAQYAPGSIFKIITATAGLQEGVINPQDTFLCTGSYTMEGYNRVFNCWKKEGHGNINLINAMAQSCDVYFYQLGLKLGMGNLPKYAKEFGLGKVTGIELPGEKGGIIPDRAWKKRVLHEGWWDGDTLNMAIGQGYLWVTPLQMVNMVSTVANEGNLFSPHIVKRIISPEGVVVQEFEPEVKKKIPLRPETLRVLKRGMAEAVNRGTAQAAYSRKLNIAGKTGTAQNPQGQDHAWFVGFCPADKPQLAFVVFVEHGGHGGVVCAPIIKKILTRYYGLEEEQRQINITEVAD
ncbi:MAG: penicillin-binding protein 2 [bacterium]